MSERNHSAPSRPSEQKVKRPLRPYHSVLDGVMNKLSIQAETTISKSNTGHMLSKTDQNSPLALPYQVLSFPNPSSATAIPTQPPSIQPPTLSTVQYNNKVFPVSPQPVYSITPLPDKTIEGLYGLPSNLEEHKSAWQQLWDDDLWDKCKYGDLTDHAILAKGVQARNRVREEGGDEEDEEDAIAEAADGVRSQRMEVRWWLLSMTRPLWVVKGPVSCGRTKEGELYLNGFLAETIWGVEDGAAFIKFMKRVEEYKHKGPRTGSVEDPYLLSIKRASLSSTARDLFGITAYPQSRPMRTFSGMTIEKLLAKPKLGPILKDIIEDGAKLIAESRWTTEELVNGQFTLRATEVMMAVEDAMVEADVWPKGVVEDAKKLPREDLHRSQAVRNTYNGKYRPLHHMILEASFDRAAEWEEEGKGATRPATPTAFHPLSVSWGVHERHCHEIDPLVEKYIEFERTARNHIRIMASSNMTVHLPAFTDSPEDLVPGWAIYNACVQSEKAGSFAGSTIGDSLHALDSALLAFFKPLIKEKVRALSPKFLELALSGSKKIASSESIPSPFRTAYGVGPQRRGIVHSSYHSLSPPILVKDEDTLQERVAEIREVISSEKDYKLKLKDSGMDWSDAHNVQLEMARSQTIDIKEAHNAVLARFGRDLVDAKSLLPHIVQAAESCLRDPYFVARNSKESGISFDQVSSLISRIILRVLFFFNDNTPSIRQTRDDLLGLLFDVLVLSTAIRTPGLTGLYLEGELRRIVNFAYNNTSIPLVARIMSRIHVDLVGMEVILTLLSSSQYRTHDSQLPKAWAIILGDDKRLPTAHPAFIQRIIEMQNRLCPVVACQEALLYQPSQLLVAGGVDQRRRNFVSVQQTVVRGSIELADNLPTFAAFPCLWIASRCRYSREITNAIARYIQVIHSTERKSAGKGQEGSLKPHQHMSLEVLLAQEQSTISSDTDETQSSPAPPPDDKSFEPIDFISESGNTFGITTSASAGPSESKKTKLV